MNTRSPATLAEAVWPREAPLALQEAWPRTALARDVVLILSFTIFTAIAAQISFIPPPFFVEAFARLSIPIAGTPVPITGQTLAMGITGAALGSRRGAASLLLYLLAGLAGLPVYAGQMGLVFSGKVAFGTTGGSLWGGQPLWAIPSGGYIVGFVVAAYLIGWLAERHWDRKVVRIFLALLAGNVVVYLFGLPWLAWVLSQPPVGLEMTLEKTLAFGLWPFIPGDFLKLVIATGVLPGAWALVRRR